MKCPRCQQENPPPAKFCLECATPLALRCANCGTQLPAGAKFCFECATPVSATGSAPRFPSPEAYTPKHLAEKILTSKAALEGERKQVTVLFADLKGSMELLADRDPEEARKLLAPRLERMMEPVHRYEGTVLAARTDPLAPPGPGGLTAETVRLAEGYIEVRSLGPIPVKGLSDPIELFELTGAGTARTRLQAAVLRGLTRFVGRDAEVEHLRRVLGQAGAGRGQVVAIVGEAGVGKSRLTYEFTHSHRVQDWLILESSSVSTAVPSGSWGGLCLSMGVMLR